MKKTVFLLVLVGLLALSGCTGPDAAPADSPAPRPTLPVLTETIPIETTPPATTPPEPAAPVPTQVETESEEVKKPYVFSEEEIKEFNYGPRPESVKVMLNDPEFLELMRQVPSCPQETAEHYEYQTLPNELFDAMTSERCALLPLPDEDAAELGILWQHHRVTVIERVQVMKRGNVTKWYLVKLPPAFDGSCKLGWLPEKAVTAYDPKAELPDDAIYILQPGVSYTDTDGTAYTSDAAAPDTNPLFLQGSATDDGLSLSGSGGWEIIVASPDCIRPADEYMLHPSSSDVP